MHIFPDAQRQLTLQSIVRSGRISNSFEMLWLYSLPAKNEEDPIKNEGIHNMSVHNIIHLFFRHSREDNSQVGQVGGGIWPKFELIQAFILQE